MAWTRRTLRMWSALCAALLLYGAIPHTHVSEHAGPFNNEQAAAAGLHAPTGERLSMRATPADGMLVENGVLVADDAHESHSPSLALDAHPCALCRDKSTHALAAVHPEPLRLEVAERSRCAADVFTRRPERLLAERHPARAPPLA